MKYLAFALMLFPSIALAEVSVKIDGKPIEEHVAEKQKEAKKVEFSVPTNGADPSSLSVQSVAPAIDQSTKVTLTYAEIDAMVKGAVQSVAGQCSVAAVNAKIQAQLAEAAKAVAEASKQKEPAK